MPTPSLIPEQADLPTKVPQLLTSTSSAAPEQNHFSFHMPSVSPTMPLQPPIQHQQMFPTLCLATGSNLGMTVEHTLSTQPLFLPGSPETEDMFSQWDGNFFFSGDLPSSGQSFDSVLGMDLNLASPDWITQWPCSMASGGTMLLSELDINTTPLPLSLISSMTTRESSSIISNASSPNIVSNSHMNVLITNTITEETALVTSMTSTTSIPTSPPMSMPPDASNMSHPSPMPMSPPMPTSPDASNTSCPSRQRKPPHPKEVTTLSGLGKEQGPPAWIMDCKGLLGDCSFGQAWLDLVEKWHQLELDIWSSDSSAGGKLLSKHCPRLLTVWLDGPRSFEQGPSITELSLFVDEMVSWWNQLNPAW
ncbi:hypothetical protein IW261DRAFT_1559944 [Armillaria novae-zelandiae]|uniref:Uncharacterized protein n=1 Tax=Armillaria novae-zelandiae TaxID=153914 RepID=A0AA39UNX1_9AGAR|nr:hypothetical protein IW261DRAFT_1559944 [Armillaria novae-zelandiae]